MKKAIIIYESTNAENLVGYLCRAFRKAGVCEITIKNVIETNVNELYDYYRILLASSVGGNDKSRNEFTDFYEEMKGLDLKGKKVAAFGTGLSSMSCFCSVKEILKDRFTKYGANVISGFEEGLYDLKISI